MRTMHELWGVTTYRKQNYYLSTVGMREAIEKLPDGDEKKDLQERTSKILKQYNVLADKYHSEKESNQNNSLVLG